MSGDHNMHCSANQRKTMCANCLGPIKDGLCDCVDSTWLGGPRPPMSTQQPEALRLANLLEFGVMLGDDRDQAAAELRRLHSVNAQLLEALDNLLWYVGQLEMIVYSADDTGEHEEVAKARAAIAAAKGEA